MSRFFCRTVCLPLAALLAVLGAGPSAAQPGDGGPPGGGKGAPEPGGDSAHRRAALGALPVAVGSKGQGAQAVVQARYDFFKGGRRMWGHGVGRKIALTFDDGPHYQTTPRLLDHLDSFGVKGTFFVNSQRFNRHGLITSKSYAALRETHRRGHLIGNHTHSHPNLPASSVEVQRREIELGDRAIEAVIGIPTFLFRPPFGAMSPFATKLLDERGSVVVMWNLGSEDDKHFNVGKIVNLLMRKIERQGGGIVLLHDTHYWSIEAVPPLLRAIRIASCRLLAEGEEPYEVVGLEYFFLPRQGPAPKPSAADGRAWLARRGELAALCRRQPVGPLPEFLRGDSP